MALKKIRFITFTALVALGGCSSASIPPSFIGCDAPATAVGVLAMGILLGVVCMTMLSSVMLFHSPHSGHLPYQRGCSVPHEEQTNLVVDLAIDRTGPFVGVQQKITMGHA